MPGKYRRAQFGWPSERAHERVRQEPEYKELALGQNFSLLLSGSLPQYYHQQQASTFKYHKSAVLSAHTITTYTLLRPHPTSTALAALPSPGQPDPTQQTK